MAVSTKGVWMECQNLLLILFLNSRQLKFFIHIGERMRQKKGGDGGLPIIYTSEMY